MKIPYKTDLLASGAKGLVMAVSLAATSLGQQIRLMPDTAHPGVILIQLPADTTGGASTVPGEVEWIGRSGIRQELIEADRLYTQGRYQETVDFLLPIWNAELETRPDEAIASALKRAYRALKDNSGWRAIIRQQLGINPHDPIAQSELAEAFLASGMNDSGRVVLDRLIAGDPRDPERHQLAAQTYMRVGRSNEGLEQYRKAREELEDSSIFAEDMARLLEARREYAAAVDEYFRWLNAKPESQRSVQKYITNLIKIPEAAPQITDALERIIVSFPGHEYAHRLYADLLFESGSRDSAFAEYRRADALSAHPGEHRLFGIERAIEKKQFEIARKEAQSFLRDYPGHSEMVRVNLALARAELALGHPDLAVGMLKTLAAQFPSDPERMRIYYEIGEIYRRYTPQKDSARAYFGAIARMPTRAAERCNAWIRIAEIEVYDGNLALADSALQRANDGSNVLQREEVTWRQAELLLLSGDFEHCGQKLKEFVRQYPRGLYVNDALSLSATLSDSPDAMNWSLREYASALLALRREQRDSALATFSQLSADSSSALADDAQMAIGHIRESEGQFPQAIDAYRVVITRFPDSFLVPRAWARIGEVYADSLDDPAQARAALQVILSEYKTSPLVEEARRRLQNLQVP